MPMCANGLAKLIEECGELQQVAGKKLAYFYTDHHPDGAGPLTTRMEAEMGDVIAAILFVADLLHLDHDNIAARRDMKRALFEKWHADKGNNGDGVDSLQNFPRLFAHMQDARDSLGPAKKGDEA